MTNLGGAGSGLALAQPHHEHGAGLQVLALGMLLVPPLWLTVPWVMGAQAFGG